MVSLGRVLLQNLILFNLLAKLQEGDERGSADVTAPLLQLLLIY